MHFDIIHLNKRIDVLNARLAWHNRVIAHHIDSDNFAAIEPIASVARQTKMTRDSLAELVARIERKRHVTLPPVTESRA